MSSYIRYVDRKNIDDNKWDHCIDNAPNGRIYAYSFYLDCMCRHWDALVMGDYECVMPLTWNKKYGIAYLYQPPFTASLGVFGHHTGFGRTADFINAIPKKYKLIEIDLNAGNTLAMGVTRTNYILHLNQTYEAIQSKYRESTRRNIRKAQQLDCVYKEGIEVSEVIALAKQQVQKFSNLDDDAFHRFSKLAAQLGERQQALACGVYSGKNELMASCVFFFSHHRAYYILVGNHPNSKVLRASHYLIDSFIQKRAGENLILDFEGSDIQNLAFFYGSFGATVETYPALRVNELPWWAKIFKRG
jgi:hypothetical protein